MAPKKKKNKTGLQPFQDPVEQFLRFFPQAKREFKGHILNKWTGRRKRQTELAALCAAGVIKLTDGQKFFSAVFGLEVWWGWGHFKTCVPQVKK